MSACDAREKLEAAHRAARAEQESRESILSKQLAGGNKEQIKGARKEVEEASRKAHHLLLALLTHDQKHGCYRR